MWDPALVVARDVSRVSWGFVWLHFYAFSTLVVVMLCLACVLTPSGRGLATSRPDVGPSSGGGAGC